MPDTTRGFPFPADADAPDIPFDIERLALDVDLEHRQGLLAARPAFGNIGRRYFATDNGHTYLDIGTAWIDVGGSDVLRAGAAAIVNGDISLAAAIAYAKLALADSVKWSDIAKDANGLAVGAFKSFRNQNIAVAHNSVTKIPFNVEAFDLSGWHDAVTNIGRFTPQVKGLYRIEAQLQFNAMGVGGLAQVRIRKNGATDVAIGHQQSATAAQVNYARGSTVIDMNGSTDYIEIYGYQNSGAAIDVLGSAAGENTFWTAHLLGRQT